jgi:ABC-type polysaccharide/polyol phosphate export permease
MGRLNGDQKQISASRSLITLIGWLSLVTLLLELGVLCLYFTGMSFLMLMSLQWNTTEKQVAMLAHMMVAVVSFVLMVGVVLCFSGVGLRKPLIKYPIILLSVLGMSVLPITIHAGLDDSFMLQLISGFPG